MSDEQAIEGGGLKVSFRRLVDRYGHCIEWDLGGGVWSGLESIEGAADEDWPPSPPLQELHFETREPGKQLALLVGRAGASHWSLSIELDASAAKVTFDIACRARLTPERLGSRYRPAIEFGDSNHPPIEMGIAVSLPGGFQLQAERLSDLISCEISGRPGEMTLLPSTLKAVNPQTLRWKYSISRAGAADVI